MKHTPGPWVYGRDGITGPDGRRIEATGLALILGARSQDDVAFQNARLIAAAPDMFEALSNIENDDGKAMPPSAWKLVQDALKKARGEPST